MGVQVNAQNDPDFPYIKALKRWAPMVIIINTILTLSFPFLQYIRQSHQQAGSCGSTGKNILL